MRAHDVEELKVYPAGDLLVVHVPGGRGEELRLHRLEAATMPHNAGSIRVLERNGFRREGIAQRLLKINGKWEDHVLHALIADEPAQGQNDAEVGSA